MTVQAPSHSALGSLFAYKAWANAELLAALSEVAASAHPDEARNAIRILNHVYVVDRIFQAHLEGKAHAYAATNTKETPTVEALTAAVRELDAWYLAYAQGLPPSALREQVRFRFTDGDAGLMSREEILLHVITHGGYHRGAAGQVMRGALVAPPRDLYTRFLHIAEPERRQ
ncbi:MAG: DinB family protein [Candidatus Limnocylindrus sp.]